MGANEGVNPGGDSLIQTSVSYRWSPGPGPAGSSARWNTAILVPISGSCLSRNPQMPYDDIMDSPHGRGAADAGGEVRSFKFPVAGFEF
jgi:hypothetical protein